MFSTITLASAFVSVAIAAGGQQDMCFGFENGNGYNVNFMYQNIQQQSVSSICGNFQKKLKAEYRWCNPGAVNCATDKDNNLFFGVSTSDQDSGFSCAAAAFVDTMEAAIVPGPAGFQCLNIVQGPSTSRKRSRIEGSTSSEGSLQERSLDSPSSVANLNDIIAVASGRRLRIVGLNFQPPSIGSAVPVIAGALLTALVPDAANVLGNTGRSIGTTIGRFDPQSLFIAFDAGINGGPGNVNEANWQIIVGALAHAIANEGASLGVSATFADAATGTVLMTVAMMIVSS
ncbi:hypothetical protein BJ875DRAFT_455632 [Amylocarpus encephaloides]|uniref:Uncharacterized protein n=1 Tax=Amylocarpus encephaloides TaxID=45428 RepID=A0A9P7YPB9_9HELO|nr:hypothetical protein BJ875DRAFT_455632 [Amylocarpus encephaloides]